MVPKARLHQSARQLRLRCDGADDVGVPHRNHTGNMLTSVGEVGVQQRLAALHGRVHPPSHGHGEGEVDERHQQLGHPAAAASCVVGLRDEGPDVRQRRVDHRARASSIACFETAVQAPLEAASQEHQAE